jgi:hypothetical protein
VNNVRLTEIIINIVKFIEKDIIKVFLLNLITLASPKERKILKNNIFISSYKYYYNIYKNQYNKKKDC